MARAAIYARISKANDRVPKVKDQEALCRNLACQHGHDVVAVYADDGISASSGAHRPEWQRLLSDLTAGKFDVLLAQSEDRFTRQTGEKDVLALLSTGSGVTWLTINEGVTDPSTADGEFFSTLRAGQGRLESKRKAERQRQANDALRAKGQTLRGGERPFGYKADKRRLKPSEADLIRQAYADLNSGIRSVGNIRTQWNNAGVLTVRGNRWDAAKVEKVLRRGRNARLVQARGELLKDASGQYVRGKWKRIVSDDD